MNENDLSWLSPAEQALARQVAPTAKAIRQFIEDTETGKPTGLTFTERIAFATQAVTRKLDPDPQAGAKRLQLIAATRLVSHGISIPDLIRAGGLVTIFLAGAPAEHQPRETRKHAIPEHLLLIVLIWLIVLAVPAAMQATKLPSDTQATVDAYDGIIASIAVTITAAILAMRKRR